MKEDWKPIPIMGFEHFLISKDGEVKNSKTDKLLSKRIDKNGKETNSYALKSGGKRKNIIATEYVKQLFDVDLVDDKIDVLDGEVWKDVFDYEDLYEVSSHGRVASKNYQGKIGSRKLLAIQVKKVTNTCRVGLVKDKAKKKLSVHRLVAQAFLPNPDNLPQVNHIDGDRLNNHVDNLEWSSVADNINHAFENNLMNKVTSPVMRICPDTGEEKEYQSISEACRDLGIKGTSAITAVCQGRQNTAAGFVWEYIDSIGPKRIVRGAKVNMIDPETMEILNTYSSIKEASEKHNISHASIFSVCNGHRETAAGFVWEYATL